MPQVKHAEPNREDPTALPLRIVRETECQRMTGLSRAQRWRLEQSGKFPKRCRLSEKAHGWLESEIQDWIRDRVTARSGNGA